jgi:hypothetical protein
MFALRHRGYRAVGRSPITQRRRFWSTATVASFVASTAMQSLPGCFWLVRYSTVDSEQSEEDIIYTSGGSAEDPQSRGALIDAYFEGTDEGDASALTSSEEAIAVLKLAVAALKHPHVEPADLSMARCVVDAYSQHRPLSMQTYRAFLKEHARRGCTVEAGVDLEEHRAAKLSALNALLALAGEEGC